MTALFLILCAAVGGLVLLALQQSLHIDSLRRQLGADAPDIDLWKLRCECCRRRTRLRRVFTTVETVPATKDVPAHKSARTWCTTRPECLAEFMTDPLIISTYMRNP